MQQTIGRQHRHLQEYDEVFVTTCNTTEFDHILFGATLNDAAYVHQSQGNKQKLIYATYLPKPRIVPFEVAISAYSPSASSSEALAVSLLWQEARAAAAQRLAAMRNRMRMFILFPVLVSVDEAHHYNAVDRR